MGEYFVWADPVRKEYLDSDSFDECGFMLSIASYQGSITTRAARMLMSGQWKGDPIIFAGDYFSCASDELADMRERYTAIIPMKLSRMHSSLSKSILVRTRSRSDIQ